MPLCATWPVGADTKKGGRAARAHPNAEGSRLADATRAAYMPLSLSVSTPKEAGTHTLAGTGATPNLANKRDPTSHPRRPLAPLQPETSPTHCTSHVACRTSQHHRRPTSFPGGQSVRNNSQRPTSLATRRHRQAAVLRLATYGAPTATANWTGGQPTARVPGGPHLLVVDRPVRWQAAAANTAGGAGRSE